MDLKITTYCLHILILVCVIRANNTSTDGDTRQPRGSGRIVKLYSGVRPDPIVCTDEGFRGDPKDCAVFYRCMKSGRGKFTAFRFQCPPGTVYDPDTEVCNHPHSTKRSECGGFIEPSSSHYGVNEIEHINELPSPISTKEPFYSTLSTSKTSVSSVSPLFTQKPANTWQSTTSSIHPISTSTKYQELMSHPWSSTTQNNLSFISSAKPVNEQQSNTEDICTYDGFMGDSGNCHKFYRCVGNQHSGFIKFEFSCSEPTIWDDDLKTCNHAWAVKRSRCGRTLADSEDVTKSNKIPGASSTVKAVTVNANKTIQSQLQIAYGNNVHQTQTQISNNAVIQNQTQINYGDRVHKTKNVTNTQNQTQISYGSAVSQSQYQLGYGKEVVQTQVQIDHSKQSSQSQIQIVESTTPTKPSTYQQDVTKTPQNQNNLCSQSGFMGDSSDCNKFYRCVDNGRGGFTRHEFSCGEGTVWDQSIEACNHAWAVKECGGKPSPAISQESTTKLPLTTSTQSYFTTSKPTEHYVPSTEVADSSEFEDVGYNNNQATSSSLGSTQSTTEIIHQTGTECKSSGFMGDATNCQIFYSCVESGDGGYTKYEFKCGEGTLWDSDIGGCNHAWAVKRCGENAIPTTATMASSTTTKLTSTVYTTSPATHLPTHNDDYDTGYGIHKEQSSSTTIKATEVLQDNQVNANNDCKSSGFMGDKNDCKKFYRCVNNGDGSYTRYEFTCGEGTAWDPKIENCNHAWAVDSCKNNSAGTGAEATTSKQPTTIHEDIDHGYNTPEYKDPDISTQKTTSSITTQKTTQAAVVTNQCSKTGFMGDTTDCKKFYRCVDNGDGSFTRYEFSCGQGTVWDQKIEACNHAWAVEKCGAYFETGHEEATTPINSVTMSEEEPVHAYPTPEYPIQNEEVTHKTTQSTTQISTSVQPSEHCKKDGFVGDEKDCKKFYRCVNDGRGSFIKYEFECGEGTVWDQSIEACNHAWAVKDCGSRNETVPINNESTTQSISSPVHSTEKSSSTTNIAQENEISNDCKTEGFIGDAKDCIIFYRCVDNGQGGFIKYEFKCGEGTYWNQNVQACDHASPDHPCKGNGNNDGTKEPTHVHDETHVETTTKTTTLLTTEIQENTPPTNKPQSSDTICNSEGFFRVQNNCQKFYRCVDDGKGGYNKYDFTCADGTIWDQDLLTCAHESENNTCSTNSSASSSLPPKPTQNIEDSFISSTTHVAHPTSTETVYEPPQQVNPDNVPADHHCTTEGFHANPTDCRKFIRCVSDGKGAFTKYDFACGEGTIWVQEILACDHDDGTGSCRSQSDWTSKPETDFATSTPPYIASSSTTVENQFTNKHEDEFNTEATKAPQVSNENCHSEGFYADKYDCKKYYRCVSNNNNGYIKYEFVCGEGTAWDENLQTCNHDSVVNCQGSSQAENQTESVIHDEISEATESSSTTTLASTTESKESSSSGNEDTCENEGYFGNTKDCKKFYRCVDNGKGGLTKYDFTCGEGTIWDQDLLTCNYPHDVANPSCKQSPGESSENTTSQPESSTSSTTKTTQSSGTSSTSSSSTTQNSQSTSSSTESSSNCSQSELPKNSGNKNVTCTKAGYFADPNDCKKFYRCVDWDGNGEKFSVYFFECGEGTIWDPALDTCNHEESVYPPRDCSNTQSQNTSTVPESTTTEQSTTQQSTTTEKSTTETTTSENTTPQTTTSAKTTTEQSTSSEQTTTQQSTTSEKTTTAQSTTSEQTTTQQSTSSETTTTEHSTTTTDGTTTQQAENTTETTTEQASTTEAVKESTTTEKTTTEVSTTISSTTTEESSTTESTTQQATSEQTTTESGTSTEQTSTTESTQQTSTTENQQETTTEHSSSSSCPDTDDDQYLFVCPTSFRRHPKYCNLFYQCTEDDDTHEVKVAVFNCPNNTIYDESKIQCVEENKAEKKCDREIAARRVKRFGADHKEPIVVTKDTHKCTTSGHMPFEKNSECSPAFLMCKKSKDGTLRGYVHRCPQNYVYWSISRRCERVETVRDCRRTTNNWSGRWEIPIDRQNVAW